jgi:Cu(I)-responsive transcriptional regulator
MSRLLNISEAAAAAGVSAKMIRHYEQIGLISPAIRTEAGYRQYSERDVSVLRFVRQSRLLGFSMEQIAELMSLWTNRGRSSREVKAIAQGHLRTIEEKLREMSEMQAQLQRLVSACHGDEHPDCAILDELSVRSSLVPEPTQAPLKIKSKPAASTKSGHDCHPKQPGSQAHVDLMAWTRSVAQLPPGSDLKHY